MELPDHISPIQYLMSAELGSSDIPPFSRNIVRVVAIDEGTISARSNRLNSNILTTTETAFHIPGVMLSNPGAVLVLMEIRSTSFAVIGSQSKVLSTKLWTPDVGWSLVVPAETFEMNPSGTRRMALASVRYLLRLAKHRIVCPPTGNVSWV